MSYRKDMHGNAISHNVQVSVYNALIDPHSEHPDQSRDFNYEREVEQAEIKSRVSGPERTIKRQMSKTPGLAQALTLGNVATDKAAIKAVLGNHENAEEIADLLADVSPDADAADVKAGYTFLTDHVHEAQENEAILHGRDLYENLIYNAAVNGQAWRGGFNPEKFQNHVEATRKDRAREGLRFTRDKQNRPYNSLRPSTRAKVVKAYFEQIAEEKAQAHFDVYGDA